MKQAAFLIIVSTLNIAAIAYIIIHAHQSQREEYNKVPEQPHQTRQPAVPYNMATVQQLHQLFTTTEKQCGQTNNALGIHTNTVRALPRIATTLERLGNAYAKLAYHDQAYTAYTTAHSLDPSSTHSLILLNHASKTQACTQHI